MGYIQDIRKYVGHSPIMVTAAACIIYDEEKGILFEKRSDNGNWCIPGGALELKESLEEGLKREVKEETNLDIFNPKFFDVRAGEHMVYPNKDEVYYTDVVYIVTEYQGELKADHESDDLQWYKIDNLPEKMCPNSKYYITKFIDKLK